MAPVFQPAAQSISLPDIGDPSQVYFGPDDEQRLGLDIMRRLRERGAIMDDVPLNDPLLYATYAQAAQRAGDMAASYSTMAEYYYLNGELLPAIEIPGVLNNGLRCSMLNMKSQLKLQQVFS